jgi:hypothetical protein
VRRLTDGDLGVHSDFFFCTKRIASYL